MAKKKSTKKKATRAVANRKKTPAKRTALRELAKRANELHDKAYATARTSIEIARDCGEALCEAKLLVKHGGWMAWVAKNFHASQDTAELYMKIATNWPIIQQELDRGNAVGIRGAGRLISPKRQTPIDPPKYVTPQEHVERLFHNTTKHLSDEALEFLYHRWEDIMDSLGAAIEAELGQMPTLDGQQQTLPPPRYNLLPGPPGEAPEDMTPEVTPVQQHGGIWLKRDDLYTINGVQGAKVRACIEIARGATGLTTAGHAGSPQIAIVARVAAHLGIPARCHTPARRGPAGPMLRDAEAHGAQLIMQRPGHTSVINSRAREDAEARGWVCIPFGMEDPRTPPAIVAQVANIPKAVKRIVITLGSGMTACGVLHGLRKHGLGIPVLGVRVGGDPTKRLKKYAPEGWEEMMKVVNVTDKIKYEEHVTATIGHGVRLDPVYEAKAAAYVEPGDLFWIIGVRPKVSQPPIPEPNEKGVYPPIPKGGATTDGAAIGMMDGKTIKYR